MKKLQYISTLISYLFILVPCAFTQDLHFSQFFNSPLTTNPANTGFIPDGDYRLGINYRDQWSSIMTVPYKTMSAFGDVQLMRDKIENGWLGVGGVILRDVAGSGNLTSTKVYGSIAYHQMLGYSSLLSLGFNTGFANKQINVFNLKFPDQFDGKFFDNSKVPTSVVLNNNNVSYFDMQAGMNYAFFPTENVYVNAGYSIHHINQPKESFLEASVDSVRVDMRHIGFLNAILKVNDNIIINPNAYFTTQAKAKELVLGMNAAYNLSGDGEKQLIGGLYYRMGDAVVPMIGFELKNVRFTFSYDVTTSSLNKFNNYRGASEFNVMKKGFYNEYDGNRRQTLCPSF